MLGLKTISYAKILLKVVNPRDVAENAEEEEEEDEEKKINKKRRMRRRRSI